MSEPELWVSALQIITPSLWQRPGGRADAAADSLQVVPGKVRSVP